jgi:hypothetical protein
MGIALIYNGEYGATVRPKLNALIERINSISNLSTMLQELESALNASDIILEVVKQEIVSMRSLAAAIQSKAYLSPVRMELTYPAAVSIRNTGAPRIAARLLPSYTLQNVLYSPAGGDAVTVLPDGRIIPNHFGAATVYVIPTNATHLYQTAQITVRNPRLRRTSSGGLRITSARRLRIV